MKKILMIVLLVTMLMANGISNADKVRGILDLVRQLASTQVRALGVEKDILTLQQELSHLMKKSNGYMTSHSGWGTYQLHDYQSYGDSARDWQNVLYMAEKGQGNGDLGRAIKSMADQFPTEIQRYNNGVSDANHQKYYALKSQTILAARAASLLDYNRIQDQIAYQRMLQQQIEKTADLKAATDLSNRIQVEGNLINLEILRQTALANQQQAITEQASVNTALFHAKFLTKQGEK